MPRDYTVQFIDRKQTAFEYWDGKQFAFTKDSKYHWLQRACFWILGKLHCEYMERNVVVTQVVIQPDKIMDSIFAQHDHITEYFNPRDGQRIYMGARNFAAMMHTAEFRQYIDIGLEYSYADTSGTRVIGIPLTVIPWMQGIIIVPERK